MKDISVIIPVYNAVGLIGRAVGSVLMQEYISFEIILVDDGSTDGSAEACDRLALEDERIRVIHKENGGVSSARNAGLDAACGRFVMFMDADDHLDQNAFTHMYFPEYDLVLAGFEKVRGSSLIDTCCPERNATFKGKGQICGFFDMVIDKKHTYLINSACFKLFRRSVIEENGLRFIRGLNYAEDKMFVTGFLLHTTSIRTVSEVLYSYLLQEDSLSSDMTSDRHIAQVLMLMENYRPLLKSLCSMYGDSRRVSSLYHNDFVGRYLFRILTIFATRKSEMMTLDNMRKLYGWLDEDKRLKMSDVRPMQIPNVILYRIGNISLTMAVYRMTAAVASALRRK